MDGFYLLNGINFETMLIRSIFYILILFIIPESLNAQNYIELNGGYSSNNLRSMMNTNSYSQIYKQGGYYFSIFHKRRCFERLYIKTGIEIIQKNYLLRRENEFSGVHELHHNMYIQFPLTFQLKMIRIKNLDFFFSSGIFGGYWLINKTEGSIPNTFDTSYGVNVNGEVFQNFSLTKYIIRNEFNSIKDNRIELGVNMGGQLEYSYSSLFSMTLGLSLNHSFTNQQKKYMIHQVLQKNQTFVVAIGIIFKIGHV